MMNLKKGIGVHSLLEDGYDAIKINSGTAWHAEQPAETVNFQEFNYIPRYEDHAYVAKRDWRGLRAEEIHLLRADDKRNDHNTVYLGDIPERLKASFRQLGVSDARSRAEVLAKLKADEARTKELNAAIHSFLSPLSNNKPFHFHCIGINFPNIEMVGCDTTKLPSGFQPQDVRHMGMHNDGTVKMTLRTAHKCGNRISVNLGKDTRSFLFVNLSMIQAKNMLQRKAGLKTELITVANIPALFFHHFPDYPVLRVLQKPYQYYIAPTDNCFHDGSTLGCTELDITMVYFGYFRC